MRRGGPALKTRAAILLEMGRPRPYAESRPVVVDEVELEEPGYGEVLVELKAAGICHSDLSVVDGSRPRPTPMVLGHEAAGIVRQTASGDVVAPGDPSAIADLWERLSAERSLLDSRPGGRAWIAEHADDDVIAERYRSVLERAVRR